MLKRTLLALTLLLAVGSTGAPGQTSPAGWEDSFQKGLERARREQKPVLLLAMFGRLDEKWC